MKSNIIIPHISFQAVDSTNTYAKKLLKEGQGPPFLITAESQTAGRGRLGKSFYSPEGGLYMSLTLKYGGSEDQTTLAAAAAVCRVLEKHCNVRPRIKPVNDLLVDGKKVCGILCEAVCGQNGEIDTVIIGVGVNTWDKNYSIPDDLKSIAGTVESTLANTELANKIAVEIIDSVTHGAEYFLPEYESRLIKPI